MRGEGEREARGMRAMKKNERDEENKNARRESEKTKIQWSECETKE